MRKITSALDDIFLRFADDDTTTLDRPRTQTPPKPPQVQQPQQPMPAQPASELPPPPAGFRHGTDEDRKKYGIPPGLTGVHVSEDPNSHLLARGFDAKGRQKSIYSSEFHDQQAAKKFNRVAALHNKIPQLDAALEADHPHSDDAAALLLSRHMGLRPGSTRDTKADVQAYGASTLLKKHVKVNPEGTRANFDFIGKEGKHLKFSSNHPHIVAAMQQRLQQGGKPNDPLFNTTDSRMNQYLKDKVGPLNDEGDHPLVKDLRTYHANAIARDEVEKIKRPPKTRAEFLARRKAVATTVSNKLGNTPVMALNSYINPTAFDPWLKDPTWSEPRTKKPKESRVFDHKNDDNVVNDGTPFEEHLHPHKARALVHGWLGSVGFWPPVTGMDADEDESDEDSE